MHFQFKLKCDDIFRYLYCDEIHLEADTVLATLYVAKKYIVPHLARACVNYLETSLTAKNACLLLSQSRLFEEPELMQRCWEVIDAQVRHSLSCLDLTRDSGSVTVTDGGEKKRHFSLSACLQSNIAWSYNWLQVLIRAYSKLYRIKRIVNLRQRLKHCHYDCANPLCVSGKVMYLIY